MSELDDKFLESDGYISEPLQIIILPDGRVVFFVQTPDMLEVARLLQEGSMEGEQ